MSKLTAFKEGGVPKRGLNKENVWSESDWTGGTREQSKMLNMIPITNCSLSLLQLPFHFSFFFSVCYLYHIISLFRMSFGGTGWRKGMVEKAYGKQKLQVTAFF